VKKIFIFLAPAMIAAAMYGCSKDHESPTFSKFESSLHKPVNLVATYIKASDEFVLKWSMPDTSSVKMFNVSWSDSNVFDLGNMSNEFTNSLTPEYKLSAASTLKKMGYTAQYVTTKADSFIVYFTVSAVYQSNTFNEFIGPRSDVDSALVYKK